MKSFLLHILFLLSFLYLYGLQLSDKLEALDLKLEYLEDPRGVDLPGEIRSLDPGSYVFHINDTDFGQ